MKPGVLIAALAIGLSRFALRARVADDYDSLGFQLALDHFDLARFQPHFPGYPVFVALGKLAHAMVPSALTSAELVSSLAAAATAVGLALIAERAGLSPRWILLLYGGASLPWILGGAALSDGTAAAFAVLAFAALAWRKFFLGGLLVGLMLGTRLSYWPLAASFFVLARDRRAIAGAALGILAWTIPFAAIVGSALPALARTHLTGHFHDWGGSIVTQPGLGARAFSFLRDGFYDGLAPQPIAFLVAAGAFLAGVFRPRAMTLRLAAIVAVPYAVWVFFAQNVIDQPRHLLPITLAALFPLSFAAARRPLAGALIAAALFFASAPLAWAHVHEPPAAAQAVDWVRAHPCDLVAGGRSIRFFQQAGLPSEIVQSTGDLAVALERMNRLPRQILITSEIPGPGRELARFCRDPRLDRREPCLSLREFRLGAAP